MITIKILNLLDELEHLMDRSFLIPLFGRRIVNEEKFFVISNKIRVSLPDEIKVAIQIKNEANRIKEEAEKEAEKVRRQAEEYAESLISTNEIIKKAQEKGDIIIRDAKAKADELRRSSDEYAISVLRDLEAKLNNYLLIIKKGQDELQKGNK